MIEPQPGILDIALYQGGASHVAGVAQVIKLSSNENPLGASPAAMAAVRDSAANLHRYPSTDHMPLRNAIAGVHGLDPARILCGNGSGEVLSMLAQAYAGPGDEVLMTQHGFSMYPIYARSVGAAPVVAPERNRRVDADALVAAMTDRTRLVYVANPANPTGTMISDAEVTAIADALPPGALLVLDGAYAEFVDGFDGGAALVAARDNVVMTRTFSKLYGLGGLRIGWSFGPRHVIDVLMRIRGPFNLSATALAAAEAAMRDRTHADHCRAENARWRDWLTGQFAEMNIPCDPSHANFVLPRFGSAQEASACDAFLRARGLIVRGVAGYDLPQCLRITVGDADACRKVAAALADFRRERAHDL